jgi:hypothetical protein
MNLESMETALRRYGFDKADPLAAWINAAMHDMETSFDWPFLESNVDDITMGVGSSTITLPAEALKIMGIRDTTNFRKLMYYDRHKFMREIEEPKEVGLPEIYTLLNTNEVQIWRVLESAVTFEVIYQATTPDMMNPADEPTTSGNVWPVVCHYPIVQRAVAIALQAEDEEERAKSAQEQYDKSLIKLMGKFGERELDEPTTVQDVQGYGTSMRTRAW